MLIGTRAARLSACGIAAIVSKKGYLEKGCSVGADGSLYNVSLCYRSRTCLTTRNTLTLLTECTRHSLTYLGSRGRRSLHIMPKTDLEWEVLSLPVSTVALTVEIPLTLSYDESEKRQGLLHRLLRM